MYSPLSERIARGFLFLRSLLESFLGMSSPSFRYEDFISEWIDKQEEHLEQLQRVLNNGTDEEGLQREVRKVVRHYERYYAVKAEAARENALAMWCPTWKTPLENAFLWIGGWRPSMIFQLAYAAVGEQLESELAELLRGMESSTLAALSSKQLYQINELQCRTLEEEDALSLQMAALQLSIAEAPPETSGESSGVEEEKGKELQNLLVEADGLRLNTLKSMLDSLTPRQSVQILIMAAQLHLSLRVKR